MVCLMGIYSCILASRYVERVNYAVTMFSMPINEIFKAVTLTNRSVQRIYMAIIKISNPALMVYIAATRTSRHV